MFIYTKAWTIGGGFKILDFNIFGGFQKMHFCKCIFLGYDEIVDILLGSLQNWTIFDVIYIHLRLFFKVKVQNRNIIGVVKYQLYFSAMLDIPDIFGGLTVDA